MNSKILPTEINEGAVLVITGQYKGKVGFYCLQNEQRYDMRNISSCSDCTLTTDVSDSLLEIETGSYCELHRQALVENDMAVIYWDKPYGVEYALIPPSWVVQIPSTVYARYKKECQKDVDKAMLRLLDAQGPRST